jgi:hypothetical protein
LAVGACVLEIRRVALHGASVAELAARYGVTSARFRRCAQHTYISLTSGLVACRN